MILIYIITVLLYFAISIFVIKRLLEMRMLEDRVYLYIMYFLANSLIVTSITIIILAYEQFTI